MLSSRPEHFEFPNRTFWVPTPNILTSIWLCMFPSMHIFGCMCIWSYMYVIIHIIGYTRVWIHTYLAMHVFD
jgi:hypothetical protein